VLEAPARPAFLLSLVALLPSSAFAVNFLLKRTEPVQIRLAPKPYGPAVPNAQLGSLKLLARNPAVQGHNGDPHRFGCLLRVVRFYHTVICITYISMLVKLFVWPLKPNRPTLARLCGAQNLAQLMFIQADGTHSNCIGIDCGQGKCRLPSHPAIHRRSTALHFHVLRNQVWELVVVSQRNLNIDPLIFDVEEIYVARIPRKGNIGPLLRTAWVRTNPR
jgi:hypothetical protein